LHGSRWRRQHAQPCLNDESSVRPTASSQHR
jgi:hypothetical protein